MEKATEMMCLLVFAVNLEECRIAWELGLWGIILSPELSREDQLVPCGVSPLPGWDPRLYELYTV